MREYTEEVFSPGSPGGKKALGVYLYHPLDSQGPVFLG
jgi:hypothetical protein